MEKVKELQNLAYQLGLEEGELKSLTFMLSYLRVAATTHLCAKHIKKVMTWCTIMEGMHALVALKRTLKSTNFLRNNFVLNSEYPLQSSILSIYVLKCQK